MSVSQADDDAFNQQAAELAELARLQKIYTTKHNEALSFCRGQSGAAWNGLYLMGLAMAGLDLIPYSSDITPRAYWVQAPCPNPDAPDDWPASWVAEIDAFAKVDWR